MTDDTRKDQEKQDELAEKDLDKASGGSHHGAGENVREASEKYADKSDR